VIVRWFGFLAMIAVLSSAAFAESPYKDNRSDAAELVRSLYDAVNRHEYARAFDYFAMPPAKDFATYEAGFADTAHVDVMTGEVFSEGAAGTIKYSVPTAIKATDEKGNATYFAGCYVIKAVNASAQEPPFRPLQIDRGTLKPIKVDDYNSAFLPKCGEVEFIDPVADDSVEKAKSLFVHEQKGHCDKVQDTLGGINEPEVHKFSYKDEGASADDPASVVTVFVFNCSLFAYNASQVFYIHDPISGMRVLSFAEPHLVIVHPEGDEDGKKLKSIKVDGFSSTTTLINAEIDDKQQIITSFDKWRGIGDASSTGTWTFKSGAFVLTDFSADPTYDDEIDPIEVIVDGRVK
jgi:Protein of unknown function (DUF1176)